MTYEKKKYYRKITQKYGLCPLCSPNKGCNKRARERKADLRCWKRYRKHQWRE